MLDTGTLLTMTPKAALVAAYNDETNLGLSPGLAVISDPIDLGNKLTQVTMGIRQPYCVDESLPFSGNKSFTYTRLDLQDLGTAIASTFGDYIPPMPCTTQAVIDELARRYNIVFDPNDIMIDEIAGDSTTYTLRATPVSLRWVGETTITWTNTLMTVEGASITTDTHAPIQTV